MSSLKTFFMTLAAFGSTIIAGGLFIAFYPRIGVLRSLIYMIIAVGCIWLLYFVYCRLFDRAYEEGREAGHHDWEGGEE